MSAVSECRVRHKVSRQIGTVIVAPSIGYWAVRFDGDKHASTVSPTSLEKVNGE